MTWSGCHTVCLNGSHLRFRFARGAQPETCSGSSAVCPPDTFKPEGVSCGDGSSSQCDSVSAPHVSRPLPTHPLDPV